MSSTWFWPPSFLSKIVSVAVVVCFLMTVIQFVFIVQYLFPLSREFKACSILKMVHG